MARITPCLENGKIARFYSDGQHTVGHGSTEFIVIRGRAGVTDNDFAYYLTCWDYVRQHAISQMTGTSGRQRVPISAFSHLEVPIPPLSEQRAIAHILGTLDDKIELLRRMNETLEAMARALFKSWFVDFDPVIDNALAAGNPIPGELQEKAKRRLALGERRKPLPEHIRRLFPDRFVDSELGPIPDGWRVGTLGDVAEHVRRGIQPNEIQPGTPYIALEHMPKRCIALSEWEVADGVESNKFEFKRGEILFGKLRPYFHKVGVAPVDGVCSTDIIVVKPRHENWFGFVLGHVSSVEFVEYTTMVSTGTKMPRTNWQDMARYEVVLPPDYIVAAFTKLVRPAIDQIVTRIHESRILAALRDALLPKLIRGEIKIKTEKSSEGQGS
jgi:type I restriction enzyme S subunit